MIFAGLRCIPYMGSVEVIFVGLRYIPYMGSAEMIFTGLRYIPYMGSVEVIFAGLRYIPYMGNLGVVVKGILIQCLTFKQNTILRFMKRGVPFFDSSFGLSHCSAVRNLITLAVLTINARSTESSELHLYEL